MKAKIISAIGLVFLLTFWAVPSFPGDDHQQDKIHGHDKPKIHGHDKDNTSGEDIQPVPEPGTLLLLWSGMGGLIVAKIWKRRMK